VAHGGDGDDIITNAGTDIGATDFLHGEKGNDAIHGGSGLALLFGGEGNDYLVTGPDGKEAFGGEGNDFILGGDGTDVLLGNEGDDWLEGGARFDGLAGENSELFFNSTIVGHDIMNGGGNDTDYDGESGDDIMFINEGIQRANGMSGFDWSISKGYNLGVEINLGLPAFAAQEAFILRDRMDLVEGASGWKHNDTIIGRAFAVGAADGGIVPGGVASALPGANSTIESFSNALLEKNLSLVSGLTELTAHKTRFDITFDGDGPGGKAPEVLRGVMDTDNGDDILLGGGGSDILMGLAGDDIISGDQWLNVRIRINGPNGEDLGSADGMAQKSS
jgi:Ca2+-binding RTX toxin-like protein